MRSGRGPEVSYLKLVKAEDDKKPINYDVDVFGLDSDGVNDWFKLLSTREKTWRLLGPLNDLDTKGLISKEQKGYLFVIGMLADANGQQEVFSKVDDFVLSTSIGVDTQSIAEGENSSKKTVSEKVEDFLDGFKKPV